jgi:hypothetical protein
MRGQPVIFATKRFRRLDSISSIVVRRRSADTGVTSSAVRSRQGFENPGHLASQNGYASAGPKVRIRKESRPRIDRLRSSSVFSQGRSGNSRARTESQASCGWLAKMSKKTLDPLRPVPTMKIGSRICKRRLNSTGIAYVHTKEREDCNTPDSAFVTRVMLANDLTGFVAEFRDILGVRRRHSQLCAES